MEANQEVLFARTLEEVKKQAKEQQNCISEQQVRDAFGIKFMGAGVLCHETAAPYNCGSHQRHASCDDPCGGLADFWRGFKCLAMGRSFARYRGFLVHESNG